MASVKSNAHFTVYVLGGERVIGVTHPTTFRLAEEDMREMRNVSVSMSHHILTYCLQMRLFDADNVNRFIGVSIDGPQIVSVWRYCHRGTLAVCCMRV